MLALVKSREGRTCQQGMCFSQPKKTKPKETKPSQGMGKDISGLTRRNRLLPWGWCLCVGWSYFKCGYWLLGKRQTTNMVIKP